jgi:gamma-glutamyltranspeptidase/glutathione hydrolase
LRLPSGDRRVVQCAQRERAWLGQITTVGPTFGSAIWQRVAQTMVNVIDFGMNLHDAMAAPRFIHGGRQETGLALKPLWNVEDRVAPETIEKLRAMGHEIRVVPSEGGAVNGVARDPKTGVLSGGADPRAAGWKSYAMGY